MELFEKIKRSDICYVDVTTDSGIVGKSYLIKDGDTFFKNYDINFRMWNLSIVSEEIENGKLILRIEDKIITKKSSEVRN